MRKLVSAAAAALVVVSVPAMAKKPSSSPKPAADKTAVVVGSCAGVATGCLFTGNINASTGGNNSYTLAQDAYNTLFNPGITLNPIADSAGLGALGGSFTGAGGLNGNWSLPGFDVQYIAVKGGNTFMLFQTSGSSGSWTTLGNVNGGGNTPGLSHLVFFGSQIAAVPEPSTWAMLILGFGLVGGAMRRRATAKVAFG